MSFPWHDIDKLIACVGTSITQLEQLRDLLYTANIDNLRHIYSQEYCGTCGGFCFTRANKLNHLTILFKRIGKVSVSLTDLTHSKLNFQTLHPSALVLPPSPAASPVSQSEA